MLHAISLIKQWSVCNKYLSINTSFPTLAHFCPLSKTFPVLLISLFKFAGYNVAGVFLPVCFYSSYFPCLVFCCWGEVLARQEERNFFGHHCGKICCNFTQFTGAMTM